MAKSTRAPSLTTILLPEALQAEESAASHAGREAGRLGNAPPGLSMRAVAEHARSTRAALPALARARGVDAGNGATRIGRLFSDVREIGTDWMLSSEKSYRSTLLGMHHGVGVFLLLEDAAIATGDQALEDVCALWLAERSRLVGDVERDLAWFAANPVQAMRRALPPLVTKLQKAVPLPEVLRSRVDHVA
ncbi:MAG: hypothetical protein JWP87_1636 [Labilithrix sp.]|nr:hypothetical protein [Labilithrix sp.]